MVAEILFVFDSDLHLLLVQLPLLVGGQDRAHTAGTDAIIP